MLESKIKLSIYQTNNFGRPILTFSIRPSEIPRQGEFLSLEFKNLIKLKEIKQIIRKYDAGHNFFEVEIILGE